MFNDLLNLNLTKLDFEQQKYLVEIIVIIMVITYLNMIGFDRRMIVVISLLLAGLLCLINNVTEEKSNPIDKPIDNSSVTSLLNEMPTCGSPASMQYVKKKPVVPTPIEEEPVIKAPVEVVTTIPDSDAMGTYGVTVDVNKNRQCTTNEEIRRKMAELNDLLKKSCAI